MLFAIFLLIAYGLVFNSVQANSVSRALKFAFDFPPVATGIVMAIAALLVIVRGIKGVARMMQWFVPVMALMWVVTSLVVCLINIDQLPDIIISIVKSAFGWQEAAAAWRGIR